MEPVSQAVLGAMGAQLKFNKEDVKKASLWGALGGMAPDLDILIKSKADPLFAIEYHRHFTHSFIFIPIGALVVSLFLRLFKVPIKKSYPYTILGYATHGMLDAFTNYGTHLWWPFSEKREAWNCVAVVDPLITIPLLIILGLSLKYKKRVFNIVSWGLLTSYLLLGTFQKFRVKNFLLEQGVQLKEAKRYIIKPTLANNFIWRVVLEREQSLKFYGVRLGLFDKNRMYEGKEVVKVLEDDILELLAGNKKQLHDYKRFKLFTDNYLFWHGKNQIADGRYSFLPYGEMPIWYVEFEPSNHNTHSRYITDRRPSEEIRNRLKSIWLGEDLK
jgi:inner membrane protein